MEKNGGTWQRVWSYNTRPEGGELDVTRDEPLPPILFCFRQTCVTYRTPIWYTLGIILIIMGFLLFCTACINLSIMPESSLGINFALFCGVYMFSGGYHTSVACILQTIVTFATFSFTLALLILIFMDFYMSSFCTLVLIEFEMLAPTTTPEEMLETHLVLMYFTIGLILLILCIITGVYSCICCISPKYKPDVEVKPVNEPEQKCNVIPLQSTI